MTQTVLASLSFAELRDRLRARAEELHRTHDIDLIEAQRYLMTLAAEEHTPDSVDALIQLAKNFFLDTQPVQALVALSVASQLATGLGQDLLLYRARANEGWRYPTSAGFLKQLSRTANPGGLRAGLETLNWRPGS